MNDEYSYHIKLIHAKQKTHRVDQVLYYVRDYLPEDLEVYDRVAGIRHVVFLLLQQMWYCQIIKFAVVGLYDFVPTLDLYCSQSDEGENKRSR